MDGTRPNQESAAAAVSALSSELAMANANIEGIDQKAGLVPPVVAAVAALFIAPDAHISLLQALFFVPALVVGIAAIWLALQTLEAKPISLGGDASEIAAGDHFKPADFNHAVAASLAIAVRKHSELTQWKGHRLNWSMRLAGVTFVLARDRPAGGRNLMTDSSQ